LLQLQINGLTCLPLSAGLRVTDKTETDTTRVYTEATRVNNPSFNETRMFTFTSHPCFNVRKPHSQILNSKVS